MQILHEQNISHIYPALKVASIVIVVSAGVIMFNDKLDIRCIFGLLLGLTSIYILLT